RGPARGAGRRPARSPSARDVRRRDHRRHRRQRRGAFDCGHLRAAGRNGRRAWHRLGVVQADRALRRARAGASRPLHRRADGPGLHPFRSDRPRPRRAGALAHRARRRDALAGRRVSPRRLCRARHGLLLHRLMADLALAGIMAIWGSSFAILRSLLGTAQGSPLALVAVRMTLASALLTVYLALFRPQDLKALLRRDLLRDGLFAGALLGIGFLLQTEGLSRTTASRSGFLTGVLVVLVPLLEFALFRKRPSP